MEVRAILSSIPLMLKRKWICDPSCYFCPKAENIDHLFFSSAWLPKWSGGLWVALGPNNTPSNINQYKIWVGHWLPNGSSVYTLGVAVWRPSVGPFGNAEIRRASSTNYWLILVKSYHMLVLSCLIGQVTMAWRLSLPYPTSPLSSLQDFVLSVLVMEMGLTSVQKKM